MLASSSTTESTMVPQPHASYANSWNNLKRQGNAQSHHPSKKPRTYDTKFKGCEACQGDSESILNILHQVTNHTLASCPMLGPSFIKDKNIREAATQYK
eukprot:9944582-Ditylum_brightwellii.AAC.1